jgi:hypothetical protein
MPHEAMLRISQGIIDLSKLSYATPPSRIYRSPRMIYGCLHLGNVYAIYNSMPTDDSGIH